jgi:rhodanese-related sulfurtransferase
MARGAIQAGVHCGLTSVVGIDMGSENTVQELARKQATGEPLLLLDVRQPFEHEIAALPHSLLVPMGELPTRIREISAPTDGMIVVYCHHGVRSLVAGNFLACNGFRNVVSLAGGIDAWSREIDSAVPRY